MSAAWPAYARIRAVGYTLTGAPSVSRLRFDDGGQRQAPAVTAITLVRRIRVALDQAREADFRAWADEFAGEYFAFRDFDGQLRQGRVVGGPGAIQYRQINDQPGGALIWDPELSLESLPEPLPMPTAEQLFFWPETARVLAAVSWRRDSVADRTELTTPTAVRQRQRETEALAVRRITALVQAADLADFLGWLRAYYHRRIAWRMEDGSYRRARIREGAAGVTLRQRGRAPGPTHWHVELDLELSIAEFKLPDIPGVVTLDDPTPTRGFRLTASLTDRDGEVSGVTWQWQRGTTDIPGATNASYTPVLADVGSTLRAVASYTDAHGAGKTATSDPTDAVANTTDQPGTITLDDTTPIRGTAIAASLTDPDTPIEMLAWQWQRGTTNIDGATNASYTPVLADVGSTLRVVAVYNDAHGPGKMVISDPTGAVANTADQPGRVTINDTTPIRGAAIRASLTDADAPVTGLTWQWQRGTTNIQGATSATYRPVLADVGSTLRAVASYNDGHGPGKTATSPATSAVANTVDQAGTVQIDDTTPIRAQAITASLTDADTPVTGLTWQWQRGTTNIQGTTNASYTPVLADVGSTLRAVASYNDAHGAGKTATSPATSAVANTTDQAGTVTFDDASPTFGVAITAMLTDLDTPITNLTWQWQVQTKKTWTDISSATNASYTPVQADIGKRLRALASYNDAHGPGKRARSGRTAPVVNVADTAGVVTLDDTTPTQGVAVTATLTDVNTPLSNVTWQWRRGNNNIAGATTASYTPTQDDVGETLRAVARYDDRYRTGRTATSEATAAVADVDDPGVVMIDDTTPIRGTAITALLTDPDGSVTNVTWQWQRGTTDISGATTASYTPVLADVGETLRAIASYNDAEANGKTATSGSTTAVANTADQAGSVTLSDTTPTQGVAVTATLTDLDTPIENLTWKWQRGNNDIAGATSATYTPTQDDVGKRLRAIASYDDAQGAGKTANSARTGKVADVDDPGVVTLDITAAKVDTAITASLTDPDGSVTGLTWQWQRSTETGYEDITGATNASYTPVAADVGKTLRAVASYNDAEATGKTATSGASDAVLPDRAEVTFTTTDPILNASGFLYWTNQAGPIPAAWMADGQAGRVRNIELSHNTFRLVLSLSGPSDELKPAVEQDLTITLTVGQYSLTVQLSDDFTEPYEWAPHNSAEHNTFVSHVNSLSSFGDNSGVAATVVLSTGADLS